ncbi:MAG TPA: hypothetical protein VKV19_01970 [Ktedonobacteraceae bacterium]|nr:hypothetical protein [Ktedonobacteraceae bacterium]
MPLATGKEGMAGAGQSEQQELPAWLESLRARERPVSSGLGEQPFSMAEVVDEDSMPRWMRQDRPRISDSGNSDAFPELSNTPKPGPNTEKQSFPVSGLAAGSLIDEQSLPSWMRDSHEGAQPETGQSISAKSLVDQQALPPWIKSLGQTEQQPGPASTNSYGLPTHSPVTPGSLPNAARMQQASSSRDAQRVPPAVPPQGFSAGELIDHQSLPGWMTGAQGPGTPPQNRPVPGGAGFSASELIDRRSLPGWMQENQPGLEQSKSTSALGMPGGGSERMSGKQPALPGNEGMPASSLLDMSSLPAWMREGEQSTPQSDGRMAAGSLVDLNAMPAWLRNSDNAPQGPNARGGQSHVEGTRVPSRPRSGPGGQEQSEAAANVFSSMLGVSASAPIIPGQEQASNLGVYQRQPAQPMQPPVPGWQSPQPPTVNQNQGAQPQLWQMSGPMPSVSSSPIPNSPAPSLSGSGSPQPHVQMTNIPPPFTGIAGADRTAVGVGSTGSADAAGTKKRGFFDAIRDFFFK